MIILWKITLLHRIATCVFNAFGLAQHFLGSFIFSLAYYELSELQSRTLNFLSAV